MSGLLLLDGIFLMRLTVPLEAFKQLLLCLRTERSPNNLRRGCENLFSPPGNDEGVLIMPELDTR